jgi:hypothetical protein
VDRQIFSKSPKAKETQLSAKRAISNQSQSKKTDQLLLVRLQIVSKNAPQ